MAIPALEQHLLGDPDDWASWLVYGDWLLEQGDVRGELIRLEHATAQRSADGSALKADIDRLVAKHRDTWLGPAPADAEIVWKNGFIVGIALPYDEETPTMVSAVLASREGRFLSSLRLSPPALDEDFDEEEIDDDYDEDAGPPTHPGPAVALAGLDLRQLRSLAFTYCAMGAEGAVALAGAPHLDNLRSLDLRYNFIGDVGVEALGAAPQLAGLTSLSLLRNDFEVAGARALARSPHLTGLATLDLRYNRIGPEGARELAASPAMRGLHTLLVYLDDVEKEGAEALAESPHLALAIRRYWKGR